MFGIIDAIEDWLRDLLISMITSNLTTLFDDVNTKVGTITTEVGQTPQGWNAGIFQMVQNLSENVIVPIAGLIITFVLCYELITAITEKNNMHDIDTFVFFKYVFKACVAVYLLSNTFTVVPTGTILLRPRQSGDSIRLPGGSKSLKKLFIDRKIPASQRDTIPVIADEQGILGVYGIGPNLDRTAKQLPAVTIRFIKKEKGE